MRGLFALPVVALVAAIPSACSSSVPAGACVDSTGCPAGNVCVDAACAQLCVSDSQCPAENICSGDVCRVGRRDNLPRVDRVDGDGTADSVVGHTEHHVGRRVILEGEHLSGAAVLLSDGTQSWPLTLCETGDTRLIVELPDALTTSGDTLLSVATQAGSCNATLPVLQGEAGSPDTPAQVRDKLSLVDGFASGVDADLLDGMDSTSFATVDHLHDSRYVTQASLSPAAVTTLTGGGNADALHTHAAQPSPWFACGNLAEMVSNCQLSGYPGTAYEYGIAYNQAWPGPIVCTYWNNGMRIYNDQPYMVESDNPEAGMTWGGFLFYRGTDSAGDDGCGSSGWRHSYWRLGADSAVVYLGGNNSGGPASPCYSTDLPVFCRERF